MRAAHRYPHKDMHALSNGYCTINQIRHLIELDQYIPTGLSITVDDDHDMVALWHEYKHVHTRKKVRYIARYACSSFAHTSVVRDTLVSVSVTEYEQ